ACRSSAAGTPTPRCCGRLRVSKRCNRGRSAGPSWTVSRVCMIDEDSVRAVEAAQWTPRFIKPLYDSYCFSQIPRLIRAVFGSADDADAPTHLLGPLAAPYDRVILFCIDALGWRFFAQYY